MKRRCAARIACVAALAVCVVGLMAAPAVGHRSPCHAHRTCPSDHREYVWANPQSHTLVYCVLLAPGAPDANVFHEGMAYACVPSLLWHGPENPYEEIGTGAVSCFPVPGGDCAGVTQHKAHLYRAKLDGIHFEGADLRDSYFVSSSFRHAHFRDAQLQDADLRWVDLSGADLTGADLTGAHLGHVKWSKTTCPDGTVTDSECPR